MNTLTHLQMQWTYPRVGLELPGDVYQVAGGPKARWGQFQAVMRSPRGRRRLAEGWRLRIVDLGGPVLKYPEDDGKGAFIAQQIAEYLAATDDRTLLATVDGAL